MNNVSLFSVESLLTAAICAAALMLAARLCERRSAELAHTLWLLALVRLATPPIFEVAVPLLPAQATPALAPATSAPAPAVTASMVEAAPASFSIAQFIAAVWLLGALFFALLALIRSIRFERRLRRALPVEETLRARVRSSAAELGVRPPRIVLLDEAVSPMIWSALRRPRLVLPAPLLRDLSDDESEALIVHELAHLRRRDHWVRHLELLVMITQWWNPLAWWGRLRLRRVEEICCDRLVSHTLPQKRRAYAESLLKTMKYLAARRVRPRAAILQLALASGVGEIDRWKGRLTMILKPTEPRRLATPWRVAATAAAVLLLVLSPTLVRAGADAPDDGSVRFAAENVTLDQALRDLAKRGEFNLALKPGVDPTFDLDKKIDIDLQAANWLGILHLIVENAGLQARVEGPLVAIYPGSPTEAGAVLPQASPMTQPDPFSGEPISMSLQQAPIDQVFHSFSAFSGLPIILREGVVGTVTVEIKGVPWDEALDAILRVHDLESELIDGKLEIFPAS